MPGTVLTRLGIACSLLLVMVLPGAGRAATTAPVQPCTQFAASPNFATDKTAFCAGHFRNTTTGQTTGFHLARTTDGGRTWASMPAAGLASRDVYAHIGFFGLSPMFVTDKTIFIQIEGAGLLHSTDGGMTFALVDPIVGHALSMFVSSARSTLALPEPLAETLRVGDHTALVMAVGAGQDGQPNQSAVIDPMTRTHTPVIGTPVRDNAFAISDTYAKDGAAFAVADSGVGLSAQVKLYRCDAKFTCGQLLYAFPKRWTFDRIWLSRDFAKTRRIFVSITSLTGGDTLWWSRDAGKTWARWAPAEQLLMPVAKFGYGYALGQGSGKLLYLWIMASGGEDPRDPPLHQLFRSRNNGDSWERAAYGRGPHQKGPRGTMPPDNLIYSHAPRNPPGAVTVAGTGSALFAMGSGQYRSFYCTWDGGVHWGRMCK